MTGNGEVGFDSEREPKKRLPHLRKAAGAQITQFFALQARATRDRSRQLRRQDKAIQYSVHKEAY